MDIADTVDVAEISRAKPLVAKVKIEIKFDSRFVRREDLPFHKTIISKI